MPHFATAHRARLSTVAAAVIFAVSLADVGYVKEPANPGEAAAARHSAAIVDAQASIARQAREARQRIRRALQTEITINFEERPLGEVLRTLGERGEFPLWIDKDALLEEDVGLDEPISARLMNVSVETALHRILPPLKLTFYVDDEVLKVTTWTEASEALRTEVFPIGDLLDSAVEALERFDEFPGGAVDAKLSGIGAPYSETSDRAAWLVETIAQTTSLIDYMAEGRDDPMRVVGDALIVRADPHALTEVGELLEAMRHAAQGKLAHGSIAVRSPGYPWELDRQVYDALARKIDLDERDRPLAALLDELSERLRIPIILDAASLPDWISSDEPITVDLRNITLSSALTLVLEPLGLTFIVEHGALIVTTGYNELPTTVVYDIGDLASAGIDGLSILSALELISAYEDWDLVPFPGVLIVRKDHRGIRKVERLLADLRRKAIGGHPAARADDASITTRFYPIAAAAPPNEVIEALSTFVKEQADPPPAEFTVRTVGSTLVIRTSAGVHRSIRKFLDNLHTAEQGWHTDTLTGPGGGYY